MLRQSMLSTVLALVLCFTPQSAAAIEKITGAFGYTLGEKFDVGKGSELSESSQDSPYVRDYRVEPPSPLDGFTHYDVRIAVDTHEISAVVAWRMPETKHECEALYEKYAAALEGKYGTQEDSSFSSFTSMTIKQGKREISLNCNFSDQLRLMYRDLAVFEAARDRAIKKKTDAVKTDGL